MSDTQSNAILTIVAHGFVFCADDHGRIWRDSEGLYRLQRNDETAQYFPGVGATYYTSERRQGPCRSTARR